MASITIAGASYPDVPSITIPKVGGGFANFYDRDVPLDFMGIDPEFVQTVYNETITLKDTLYNGWTPSTTAKTIVASQNLSDTYAANTADYEYYLDWVFDTDIQYTSGATMKVMPIRNCVEIWQGIFKRPSSTANLETGVYNTNSCVTVATAPLIEYYTSKGAQALAFTSYGFYIGATAATFSNSTTDSPNITIKTPTISARCSTTYFAVARAAEIDQNNTKFKLRCDIYRVKVGSAPIRKEYESLSDLYKHPLF